MRVLFVDDEPDILEQAKLFLEKEKDGLDIDTVISAGKALELFEKNDYDCIVSDYQMPEMDGLSFLKILRNERQNSIPFIMFTGKGREEVAIEALNLGADRYLQKGGDPRSQYDVLAQAIIQEIEYSQMEERENFFEISATHAPEAIFVSDKNANIIYVNKQASENLGYSIEELEDMKIFDLDPNFSSKNWNQHWKKSRKKGKTRIESDHIKKDGTKFSVELLINHIEHMGEEYHFTFARDITDRKKMEKELSFESDLMESLMDNLPDFVYFKDEDARYVEVSESYAEMINMEKDEIIGRKVTDLYSEDEGNRMHEDDLRVIEEGGKIVDKEDKITIPNGETRWMSTTKIPRYDDEGNVIGMFGVSRDITDRMRLEKRIANERDMFVEGPVVVFSWLNESGWPIDYVSPNVEEVLGYEPEDFTGGDLVYTDVIADEDVDKVIEENREASERGEPRFEHSPYRIVKKNGDEIWVYDLTTIVRNDKGEITRYQGYILDITQQMEREEESRLSKDIITKSPIVVFLWRNEEGWPVEFVTEDVVDIYGYSPEDFTFENMKFIDTIHPDDRSRVREEVIESSKKGRERISHEPYRIITREGNVRWIKDETYIKRDEKGNILNYRGIQEDITQRKKAEEREEFLHSLLRHDVRNKAQIVQGYLELLRDTDLSEEQSELIEKASKASEVGVDIIEKVRTLRKVSEERRISEVGIRVILKNVISGKESQASERDIEIDFEMEGCKVLGGPLLEELFSNLVENSIKHADCEKIRISGRKTSEECIITVEDDGKGISDEDKNKIFEKGFKSGKTGGSGLGLFLVKEIAESYGGSVEVNDSELGGARFDVHLKKT